MCSMIAGISLSWMLDLVQVETGTPFMLFKDHCNEKSNQQNLGTIKCSNLCTEVVEYTAPDEVRRYRCLVTLGRTPWAVRDADSCLPYFMDGLGQVAVCNLASINLSAFVDDNDPNGITYDFQKLYEITKVVTRNLNKVIDINFYPVEEARNSNMRHR